MTTQPRQKSPAADSTLAIGGVSSPLDSLVVDESSQLQTNFCAVKTAHRQAPKRYKQFKLKPDTNKPIHNLLIKGYGKIFSRIETIDLNLEINETEVQAYCYGLNQA
jgi:hypothetical protein